MHGYTINKAIILYQSKTLQNTFTPWEFILDSSLFNKKWGKNFQENIQIISEILFPAEVLKWSN